MADKKYTLSLQLTADGSQAMSELEKVGKAAEETARKVEKPKRIPAKVKEGMSRPKTALVPKLAPADKVPGTPAVPPVWDIRANIRPAVEEAYKAKQMINQLGQTLLPWSVQMERPAMAIDAKQSARPESAAGIISTGRKFALRPMDKESRARLDKLAAKSVTMTIQADGTPALVEGEKTKKGLEDQGKNLPPWKVRLQGFGKGLYEKTLKGFGGDMSRTLGLDKIGSGMQSGLGKAMSFAGAGFSALWKTAGFAFRGIWSGVRMAGAAIRSALLFPVQLATGAFKALGVGAAAALAGIYAGLKALGPAAEMQQFSIQVETMLKDPKKAKQRLDELKKYAKDTNYGPKEIIEAGNLMEAFGFYSLRNLKLAGDAANAFGKDINEIVRSLNYLASGRGGEAIESLARIGVTRDKLKPFGVEFKKSGELKTDPKKAMEAVLLYFEKNFGGMTERQKKTWKGAMQQMGGEVYNAFDVGFKKALGPLTEFVQQRAIPLIESIGKRLEKIDWKKSLARPLKLLGGVAELIRQAMDPKTSERGMKNLKAFGSSMWEGLKKVIGLLPAGFKALVGDLSGILEAFIGSGGMGKVLDAGWQMLKLSWQLGASLLSGVLTSFSREFQSKLKIITEALVPFGDNSETKKHKSAKKAAEMAVAKHLEDNDTNYNWLVESFGGTAERLKNPKTRDEINRRIGKREIEAGRHLDVYNATYRKEMGYDDPTTSPFYRDPAKLETQISKTMQSLSGIKMPDLNFGKTAAWGKQFSEEAEAAFARPATMISNADAGGRRRAAIEKREEELQARRQALIDDPKLAEYRRDGWNKAGKERSGQNAAEARENHWRRVPLIRIEVSKVDQELKRLGLLKDRNAQIDVSKNTETINNTRDAKPRKPENKTPKNETSGLADQVGSVNNTIGQGNQQVQQRLSQGFADISLLLGQNKLQNQSIITEMQTMNKYLAAVMGA